MKDWLSSLGAIRMFKLLAGKDEIAIMLHSDYVNLTKYALETTLKEASENPPPLAVDACTTVFSLPFQLTFLF